MNSIKLKEKYWNIYSKFYEDNDIILSMPFVVNRMWDFFNDYEWISIKQKIPLRIYLWLTKSKKVEFWDILFFDHLNKDFDNVNFESIIYVKDYIDYIRNISKETWIKINILSEIPKSYWMWFNSIFSSILDIWVNIFLKNISSKEIVNLSLSNNINVDINEKEIWKFICRKDKLIPSIWRVGLTTIITSFFNYKYHFIGWRKIKNWTKFFYTYKIEELLKNTIKEYNTFDYYLYYSWIPSRLENLNYQFNDYNNNIIEGIANLKNIILEKEANNEKFIWIFSENFLEEKIIKSYYNNLLNISSLEVLYKFLNLYKWDFCELRQSELILSLNKIRIGNYITKEVNRDSYKLLNNIILGFNEFMNDEISINQNDSLNTWWSIIICSKSDHYRSIIKNKLEVKMFTNFYNSFEDWFEENWIIFHKVKYNLDRISFYSNTEHNNYNSIKDIEGKFDILINNKINKIKFKNLQNPKLLSHQTTCELLSIFLKYNKELIHNTEISRSTYSLSKSEMKSKIIKPFVLECNKYFWEDKLTIELEWKSNSYFIKFRTKLKIWIID